MKFIVACKKFFDKKGGQTTREFMDEVKKLTPDDRRELTPLLENELDTKIEV